MFPPFCVSRRTKPGSATVQRSCQHTSGPATRSLLAMHPGRSRLRGSDSPAGAQREEQRRFLSRLCPIERQVCTYRGHPGLSCADLWERAAFLEPRLPHQRADTDPRDSGLQRFARPPESDLRAPWRPPVPANPAQGSLATETANPTLAETLRCLADRVRPERATRLKPEPTAPHTWSGTALQSWGQRQRHLQTER